MFDVGSTYEDRAGRPVRVLARVRVQQIDGAVEERLLVLTNHGHYDQFGTRTLDGQLGDPTGWLVDPSPTQVERDFIADILAADGQLGEAGRVRQGSPLRPSQRAILKVYRRAVSNT